MSWFTRAAKAVAHPTLEARLRAGQFAGLDPEKVEEFLGPKPVHCYDVADQPAWVKKARQWVYLEKLPPFEFPVHAWSAGLFGDVKSPITWFRCKTCGGSEIGMPTELPDRGCMACLFARRDFDGWEVADQRSADAETFKACDGKTDLMARTRSSAMDHPWA